MQPERHQPLEGKLSYLNHVWKIRHRAIAAEAEMDSALLNKVELRQRLPPDTQTRALAAVAQNFT
jgi:hypothetical protein